MVYISCGPLDVSKVTMPSRRALLREGSPLDEPGADVLIIIGLAFAGDETDAIVDGGEV